MITVEARRLGAKAPLAPEWSVPLPGSLGETPNLRSLITAIVREEVGGFRRRQADRRLLQVLTPDELRVGEAKGKILPGGADLNQEVDEEQAVRIALQAFDDGIYLVILDGVEQRDLDAQVALRADSRVVFVRLAMLAGG